MTIWLCHLRLQVFLVRDPGSHRPLSLSHNRAVDDLGFKSVTASRLVSWPGWAFCAAQCLPHELAGLRADLWAQFFFAHRAISCVCAAFQRPQRQKPQHSFKGPPLTVLVALYIRIITFLSLHAPAPVFICDGSRGYRSMRSCSPTASEVTNSFMLRNRAHLD